MHLRGEGVFSGAVCRGLSDDYKASCAGKRVVVLGMGAFAIENMRTSFERGAAHVAILCRQRGTACPQIVDWVNFVRPFNKEGRHQPAGDAVVLSYWQQAYDTSGALRPECWREGMLKPDGHTVSTSDVFFIAHFAKRCMTLLGEVGHLETSSVVTSAQEELDASVIIKCVGFELNEGNERLLGRLQMRCTGLVERKLWLQVEPHLDSRFFSSPFGSSYLNMVRFNITLMLRYLRDPGLAERVAQLALPLVRINTFTASEATQGTDLLPDADPDVPLLLNRQLLRRALLRQ